MAGLVNGVLADDYEELFRQAADLGARGEYARAIDDYRAALRLRPDAAEALNNLAAMYYAAGRYGEAFETTAGIWKVHPEMASAALIHGMAAVQCNRAAAALEPLQAVLAKDPSNRDAVLALATAHLALEHLPQAVALYERQTARTPDDAKAWYGLAICNEKMAEEASQKLAQMPGGAAYSKRLLGEYMLSMGDARLAREAFGEAVTAPAAESPEAARQYADALNLAGKSRQAFERFITLAPDSWQAELFRGDVERQHGNLDAALTLYQNAARLAPANPAPLLGLGTVHWELGQFDEAEKALRETLRLKPDSAQASFELANIAVRRHRYQTAIPLLQKYLSAHPDALAARADLGLAYIHTERFPEAADELTKAQESDQKGEIHYQLSIALRKLGRMAEADAALRRSDDIRQGALKREERLVQDH